MKELIDNTLKTGDVTKLIRTQSKAGYKLYNISHVLHAACSPLMVFLMNSTQFLQLIPFFWVEMDLF